MKTKIQESAVSTPAFFAPNHGQYPQEVLFAASAKHTQFYFMKSHILHAMELAGEDSGGTQGVALSMVFVDANPDLSVQSAELYEGKVNYFIGNNADEWKSNIPTYGELKYINVWKGISLTIRHTEKGIKLDWHVAPGTSPDVIRLTCGGADSLSVGDDGSLVLAHRYGEVREEAPVAYQLIDGRRVDVPCGYRLDGTLSYGFWLGEGYDPAREIIIDPLLPYATLLGGSGFLNRSSAIAVDAEGCAYILGSTSSTSFPVTPGAFQTTLPGSFAAFVTKFSADGSHLIYSTYLGGNGDFQESSTSIAIDSAGHAYVTGSTLAPDFPITPGAFQTSKKGVQAPFITKLSPDGASLVYSTYFCGSAYDNIQSIQAGTDGSAYVGGLTSSPDFPITPGAFQTSFNGAQNGFISKLSANGTALIYSTYLGGTATTHLQAIAIDSAGSVYATGKTRSQDFPVTSGAFQTTIKGGEDVFVTKLSSDGSSLEYGTYVGGSEDDQGNGICTDEQGNAYVTGVTYSADFPVTPGAAQGAYGGEADAFVLKLSADGSALIYGTYLGGAAQDYGSAIAMASGSRACVAGGTGSSNFPTTPWVRPTALQGDSAAFLTIVSEDGTSFIVSNYIGGDSETYASGIAIGADGSVYIAGTTRSSNFPVTPGAFQTTRSAGLDDAFVYRTRFAMYAKASVVITKL